SFAPAPGQPHRQRLAQAVDEVVNEVVRALDTSGTAGSAPRPEFLVAAGMLSSEVGLLAVPHVPAPAGLDDLARGVAVAQFAEWLLYVVPGIKTPAADGPDGWFEADVMRGEECETLGALPAV